MNQNNLMMTNISILMRIREEALKNGILPTSTKYTLNETTVIQIIDLSPEQLFGIAKQFTDRELIASFANLDVLIKSPVELDITSVIAEANLQNLIRRRVGLK